MPSRTFELKPSDLVVERYNFVYVVETYSTWARAYVLNRSMSLLATQRHRSVVNAEAWATAYINSRRAIPSVRY